MINVSYFHKRLSKKNYIYRQNLKSRNKIYNTLPKLEAQKSVWICDGKQSQHNKTWNSRRRKINRKFSLRPMSSVGLLEMNADSPMYQPTDISPLYRKRHKISDTQLKWELKKTRTIVSKIITANFIVFNRNHFLKRMYCHIIEFGGSCTVFMLNSAKVDPSHSEDL